MAPKKTQSWKIRIIIRSYDYRLADKTAEKIIEATERAWAIVAGPIPMPTKIKKITVNRSTFVHKDSRKQYEIRIHKRLIDINESTPQTIETLKSLSLPSWVDIEMKMIQ